jgi:Immunity protein Imm6
MLKKIDPRKLTVTAKTALALRAAEIAAPHLDGPARALADEVLRTHWSWFEKRTPDASALYWTYNPKLMELEPTLHKDRPKLTAFHCVLYAHYYVLWQAQTFASVEQPDETLSLGNDINEVDESYLTKCLEAAIKVSPAPDQTEALLNQLITKLGREHPANDENELGGPIRRDQL